MNVTLAIIATAAGILGAIAAVIALLPDSGPATPSAGQSPTTISSTASVTRPANTGPPTSDLLVRLTPHIGRTLLTDLPEGLRGAPQYADSVAIACPSNENGQKQAEVSYESRGIYRTFTATLDAYREPAAGVRMQLYVFLDPTSRDFGIDNEKPGGGQIQLTAGQTQTFTSAVKDAYYVRLRLICEKPGGMLILRQAAFSPRSVT
jgi:hypothetical protein